MKKYKRAVRAWRKQAMASLHRDLSIIQLILNSDLPYTYKMYAKSKFDGD